MRNQGADHDPPIDRLVERLLDLRAVESENDDVDSFFGALDGADDQGDAVAWLDDELHFVLGFFSVHSTAA